MCIRDSHGCDQTGSGRKENDFPGSCCNSSIPDRRCHRSAVPVSYTHLGVTFSGGEPFLHPEFIQKVSEMCKAEGYTTAVETCGNFCLSPVLKIIDLIDHVLFDIKIIEDMYKRQANLSSKVELAA